MYKGTSIERLKVLTYSQAKKIRDLETHRKKLKSQGTLRVSLAHAISVLGN